MNSRKYINVAARRKNTKVTSKMKTGTNDTDLKNLKLKQTKDKLKYHRWL